MSMAGYTKLFNSILASTIWREDDKTRIVWITLLAMADRYGIAEGSVPGLADFARVSVEDCRAALVKLAAPDEDSRSQEFEGRRIEAVEGGWRLLNHEKYRQKLSADERREYLKLKQREYRHRDKQASTTVNNVSDTDTVLTQAEAEAEAEATPEATPKVEAKERALKTPRGTQHGRIYLHRWQLERLIDVLGPHAPDFDLDAWVLSLSALSESQGLVLPKANVWPWVQVELEKEIQRRGLVAVGEPIREPTWTFECPHAPHCRTIGGCVTLTKTGRL